MRCNWMLLLCLIATACQQGPGEAFEAGVNAIHQGQYDRADSIFTQIIEEDAENAGAYNNRAFARIRAGKIEPALDDARKALQIDPDKAKYHITAGEAFFIAGQMELATEAAEQAIALDPMYVDAFYFLSSIRLATADYAGALRATHKALELDPGFDLAQHQRIVIYIQQGKFEHALFESNKLIDAGALAPIVFRNRGYIYLQTNRLAQAREDFEKALKIDEQDAVALNNLGYTKFLQGDTLIGLSAIEESLLLNADNPYAYRYKGDILWGIRQADSACWYWKKAQSLLQSQWPVFPVRSDSAAQAQIQQHCR